MAEFDLAKLRRIDATILLIFLGLMRHRKAATVGEEMGLTPSSVSHSLTRLRNLFDDPLFLRRPHGLEPTAVALALEPSVRRVLETLNDALEGPAVFDPTTASRLFRIGAYDAELSLLIPPLVKALSREAPGIRVGARVTGREPAVAALRDGEIDLGFGLFRDPPPDIIAEPLLHEQFAVVVRNGDPLAQGPLTLEAYTQACHLVVSPGGDLWGIVDTALEAMGLRRHVVLAVPLFMVALATVAETGLVATLPSRLANRFAGNFGLVTRDPPLAVRGFTISALRHRRDERSAIHDWVLATLRKTLPAPA